MPAPMWAFPFIQLWAFLTRQRPSQAVIAFCCALPDARAGRRNPSGRVDANASTADAPASQFAAAGCVCRSTAAIKPAPPAAWPHALPVDAPHPFRSGEGRFAPPERSARVAGPREESFLSRSRAVTRYVAASGGPSQATLEACAGGYGHLAMQLPFSFRHLV